MPVEMDMNYPSHAVDAILDHRYGGLDTQSYGATPLQSRCPSFTEASLRDHQIRRQNGRVGTTATDAMLQHRYGWATRK